MQQKQSHSQAQSYSVSQPQPMSALQSQQSATLQPIQSATPNVVKPLAMGRLAKSSAEQDTMAMNPAITRASFARPSVASSSSASTPRALTGPNELHLWPQFTPGMFRQVLQSAMTTHVRPIALLLIRRTQVPRPLVELPCWGHLPPRLPLESSGYPSRVLV